MGHKGRVTLSLRSSRRRVSNSEMSYEPPPAQRELMDLDRDRETPSRPRAGAPWSVLWFEPPPDETDTDSRNTETD